MKSGRKWMTWLGVLLAVCGFAAATALVLLPASAGGFPFSWKIRSNLSADYRYAETTASFGVFRLSIISDMLRDMGMVDEEAVQHENAMKLVMDAAVPTATAFDFEGNPPLTATPTKTKIPTTTPTDTPESTSTRAPTRVPTRTATKERAATSVPSEDTEHPIIADPGIISPSPGDYGSCRIQLTVSDAQITDAAPSSGISWVKLKYKVYDYAEETIYAGYIYSSPLTLCDGGETPSGGWDACYSGPSTTYKIEIYPGFSSQPDYTESSPFKVMVWMLIEDNKGYQASHYYGAYELPSSCDDPSSPTDMPTATAMATATASATATATATATALPTATATATTMPTATP